MNTPFLPAFLLSLGLLLAAGCSHIEIKPEGNPDRVITGTVNFRIPAELPPDASVTVRLLGASSSVGSPEVLGEQQIKNPGTPPIAFRIEYFAPDALLRGGLSLDARVAIGGKLRFYNINSYPVTPSNAADPHEIWVDPTGRE